MKPMRDIEEKAIKALEIDHLVDYLCELISIPSFGGQESAAQRSIVKKMGEIGLKTELWEIDFEKLRVHPSFSMSIERSEGLGVQGIYGNTGGRHLILNGHIDVVSSGDDARWINSPWFGKVIDDRVYGRGSADMKGGLVCALFALKALIDSDTDLRGKVTFSSVIGEEDGGVGALDAVLRGLKGDAALVMEPSDLDIVPSHAGVAAFRVTIKGKAAHAAIRDEGVSAIDKFLPIYDAIRNLETERNAIIKDPLYSRYRIPSPISIGKIRGGEWPGTVPDELYFEGRIGVHVGEDVKNVQKQLENSIYRAAEKDPWLRENRPSVEWRGYRFDPASIRLDHPIIESVRTAYRDICKTDPRVEGKTYSSDMRFFCNLGGTPAMIFGPGEVRQAHSVDENIKIENLELASKVIILTIIRYCGM